MSYFEEEFERDAKSIFDSGRDTRDEMKEAIERIFGKRPTRQVKQYSRRKRAGHWKKEYLFRKAETGQPGSRKWSPYCANKMRERLHRKFERR